MVGGSLAGHLLVDGDAFKVAASGTEVTELQFDPGCAGPLLQSWEQRASSPPCLRPALEGKSWQAESFCPARTVLKMLKFI